jgi:hypothetical protein
MNKSLHPLDFAKQLFEQGFRGLSQSNLSPRTLRKYLWIGSIPQDLQKIMKQYDDLFTARVLVNAFASRQKHFEKENWKYLRAEIARYLKQGKGHRPRKALNYPKNRAGGSLAQQRKRQEEKGSSSPEQITINAQPAGFMQELCSQEKLRERLATWVEVSNGEIRIKYFGTDDLERLTEIIEGPREDLDNLLFGRRAPEQDARL